MLPHMAAAHQSPQCIKMRDYACVWLCVHVAAALTARSTCVTKLHGEEIYNCLVARALVSWVSQYNEIGGRGDGEEGVTFKCAVVSWPYLQPTADFPPTSALCLQRGHEQRKVSNEVVYGRSLWVKQILEKKTPSKTCSLNFTPREKREFTCFWSIKVSWLIVSL